MSSPSNLQYYFKFLPPSVCGAHEQSVDDSPAVASPRVGPLIVAPRARVAAARSAGGGVGLPKDNRMQDNVMASV